MKKAKTVGNLLEDILKLDVAEKAPQAEDYTVGFSRFWETFLER